MPKKLFSFIIILFSIITVSTAKENLDSKFEKLSFGQKCFELIRNDITGFSLLSEDFSGNPPSSSKELRKVAAGILKRPLRFNVLGVKDGLVADVFFENASAILFSTFDENDLIVPKTDNFTDEKNIPYVDWVDEILLSYNENRFSEVASDIADEIKSEKFAESSSEKSREEPDWNEFSKDELSENDNPENENLNNEDSVKQSGESEKSEKTAKNEAEKKEEDQKIIPEYLHFSKNLKLRRFNYDDEYISINSDSDKRIFVSQIGTKFKRKFYSENYLLEKVEYWEIGATVDKTKLLSQKIYEYKENVFNPVKCTEIFLKKDSGYLLSSSGEKDFEKEILHRYNDDGKLIETKSWHYEMEEEKSDNNTDLSSNATSFSTLKSEKENDSGAEKKKEKVLKVIDQEDYWKYTKIKDKENPDTEISKVLEEKHIMYAYYLDYRKNKKTEKTEIKNIYNYNGKSSNPDILYYENGELHVKTVYTNQSDFMKTLYFDNGVILEVFYENGTKKTETLKMAGKIVRRRAF